MAMQMQIASDMVVCNASDMLVIICNACVKQWSVMVKAWKELLYQSTLHLVHMLSHPGPIQSA